jgi:hypothetical protein
MARHLPVVILSKLVVQRTINATKDLRLLHFSTLTEALCHENAAKNPQLSKLLNRQSSAPINRFDCLALH